MNISAELSARHSKQQTLKIENHIGVDPEKFSELMSIVFGVDYRLAQRAAWVLGHSAEKHPELAAPYLPNLTDQLLRDDVHDAVKRNIVRLMQYSEIPEKLAGKVFSICVDLVDDPAEPVAIRVFAMSVAANIADGQPDLMNELRTIALRHIPHSTAAFRARARNVFKS